MPSCSVFGCKNSSNKTKELNIKYFSFPKDEIFCRKWILACKRRDKFNTKNARICSVHFTTDDFFVPLRQQLLNYAPRNCRNLKKDTIPTQSLPMNTLKHKTQASVEREERMQKRRNHLLVETLLKENHDTTQQLLEVDQIVMDCIPETSVGHDTGTCGYAQKFREMSKHISEKHPEVKLNGYVGRRGSFEVKINGDLVHSKLNTYAYPDYDDLANIIKEVSAGNQARKCKSQPTT